MSTQKQPLAISMAYCSVDRSSRLSDAVAGQTRYHLSRLRVLERRGLAGWWQIVGDLLQVVEGSGLVHGSRASRRCSPLLAVLPTCWGLVVGGPQSPWETIWTVPTLESRRQPSLARQWSAHCRVVIGAAKTVSSSTNRATRSTPGRCR